MNKNRVEANPLPYYFFLIKMQIQLDIINMKQRY
nr:MAG TPA: hypothetical protein [Caudoviricetes sp.]